MTPSRTSKTGSYRFKRVFQGVGAIRRSAETTSKVAFRERDGVLTKLWKHGRLDLLRDFRDKKLSIAELVDLDRRGVLLTADAQDAVAHRDLWTVAEATLPRMGKKPVTRDKYVAVLKRLQARGTLGRSPTLAQLPAFDWPTLRTGWPGGPSDWNHVGRTLSALLSQALGSRHHPIRLAFQRAFPYERERERMPDMLPETFEAVVAQIPEPFQPIYWTLVATGMRISEYRACTPRHLYPETRQLEIPGTKTKGSADVLPIAAHFWPWVVAAIPCPIGYRRIRDEWTKAQTAVGLRRHHTLHDIRHLTGQFLADAGLSDAQIGQFLRHTAPQSVRRYSKRRLRAADAELLGNQFSRTYLRTNQTKGMRHGKRS